jgi:phage-related holin
MFSAKLSWLIAAISASTAYVLSYILDVTTNNIEQYMAVIAVMFMDGFFGIIAGTKREGFKTCKAIQVLRNIFTWIVILTVTLMVEKGFTGTAWLSEVIITPFLIFQIISALKNASMAGFIKGKLLNDILDQIDKHKGDRNTKK